MVPDKLVGACDGTAVGNVGLILGAKNGASEQKKPSLSNSLKQNNERDGGALGIGVGLVGAPVGTALGDSSRLQVTHRSQKFKK